MQRRARAGVQVDARRVHCSTGSRHSRPCQSALAWHIAVLTHTPQDIVEQGSAQGAVDGYVVRPSIPGAPGLERTSPRSQHHSRSINYSMSRVRRVTWQSQPGVEPGAAALKAPLDSLQGEAGQWQPRLLPSQRPGRQHSCYQTSRHESRKN